MGQEGGVRLARRYSQAEGEDTEDKVNYEGNRRGRKGWDGKVEWNRKKRS